MGKKAGVDLDAVPVAYEKIVSSVGDADLSTRILDASLKTSKATFTDVDTVAGAVAKMVSIVGEKQMSAAAAADMLTAAQPEGAASMADFAQYLPGATNAGRALGIEAREVAGAFAYFTAKGQDAAGAGTLLENAFGALSKKKEVTDEMKKFGVSVYDAHGKMRPLLDIVTDLKGRMAGLSDAQRTDLLEKMGLKDAQARDAFNLLMGDVEKLKHTIDATSSATGAVDAALKATGNTGRDWQAVWSQVQGIMIDIGGAVLPVLTTALGGVTAGLGWLKDHGGTVARLMVAIGAGLVIANAGAIGAAIGFRGAQLAAWALNGGMKGLRATLATLGIPLLIWGLVELGNYLYETYQKSQPFRASLAGIGAVAKELGGVFMGLGKIILGTFTFNPALFLEGVAQVKSTADRFAEKGGFAGIYAQGAAGLVAEEALAARAKKKAEDPVARVTGETAAEKLAREAAEAALKRKNEKGLTGLDKVSGGGAKQTTFNMSIGKFQDSINLNTTLFKEGVNDAVGMVEDALLRMVTGINQVAPTS